VIYQPHHFKAGEKTVFKSQKWNLYPFKVYVGSNHVEVEENESAWFYQGDPDQGFNGVCIRGPVDFTSEYCCTVVTGYTPPDRSAQIESTNLPYVNGCSTESLLPPVRLGDPTMQVLYMPPNSSEQQHHIHSTARVVFVMSGTGTNIYGMDDVKEIPLNALDVLVLDKMIPHHFVTSNQPLFVSPFHVFSSIGRGEQNHPMFNGTHMTD